MASAQSPTGRVRGHVQQHGRLASLVSIRLGERQRCRRVSSPPRDAPLSAAGGPDAGRPRHARLRGPHFGREGQRLAQYWLLQPWRRPPPPCALPGAGTGSPCPARRLARNAVPARRPRSRNRRPAPLDGFCQRQVILGTQRLRQVIVEHLLDTGMSKGKSLLIGLYQAVIALNGNQLAHDHQAALAHRGGHRRYIEARPETAAQSSRSRSSGVSRSTRRMIVSRTVVGMVRTSKPRSPSSASTWSSPWSSSRLNNSSR